MVVWSIRRKFNVCLMGVGVQTSRRRNRLHGTREFVRLSKCPSTLNSASDQVFRDLFSPLCLPLCTAYYYVQLYNCLLNFLFRSRYPVMNCRRFLPVERRILSHPVVLRSLFVLLPNATWPRSSMHVCFSDTVLFR